MNNYKKDFTGETYFLIPVKNSGYKIYPFNADIASAYYEAHNYRKALNYIKCGAV